ncbi:MAG: hypothetical protein AABW52_04410 [Nanoarchaeota archaeon]
MNQLPYVITDRAREDNPSSGANGVLTQVRLENLCENHGTVLIIDDWGNLFYITKDIKDSSCDESRPLVHNLPSFRHYTKERWSNGCRPDIAVVYSYYEKSFEKLSKECGRAPIKA